MLLDALRVNQPGKGCDDKGERCSAFGNKRQKKLTAWLRRFRRARAPVQPSPQLRLVQVIREHRKLVEDSNPEENEYNYVPS